MDRSYAKTIEVLGLLALRRITIDASGYLASIREYHKLCSTWNLSAKLISAGDLARHFDDHIADSLSLLPWIAVSRGLGAKYLDIGSGGGLPAIPIGLTGLIPSADLIERSATKAEFLRFAVTRLGLQGFKVLEASYPSGVAREGSKIITARATENPEVLDRRIAERLDTGDAYLAERAISKTILPTGVIAEEINDEFSTAGLRRGKLNRVTRQVPRGT